MRDDLRFIVLDGVEGCGKSTQIGLLAEALRAAGEEPVVTHEPGGTAVGDAIRALLLSPEYPDLAPLTETFLFCASRAQHVQQVIRPALEDGRIVLCDRFDASTFAYQGFAGGVGVEVVERLNEQATGGLVADLTAILDLAPEVGMRRKFGHAAEETGLGGDRIERHTADFHRRVREGFLEYARRNPDRCAVVDADRSPEDVFADLAGLLEL